jgi:hypothetical protein
MDAVKTECKRMEDVVRKAKGAGSGRMELLESGVADFVRAVSRGVLQSGVERTYETVGHGARPCVCGKSMHFVQERHVRMVSTWGEVKVRKTYFHCHHCQRAYSPEEEAYDLKGGDYTVKARQEVVRQGAVGASFAAAAMELKRRGIPVSDETVRKMTEAAGHRVWRGQSSGELESEPVADLSGPVYVSCDAAKVNTLEGWKDVKLGEVYDQSRKAKRFVCHLGEPSALGMPLRRHAAALGLKETKNAVAIADGAPWIWNLVEENFPGAQEIVDFFHVSEHLAECARQVFGEENPKGRRWLDERNRQLKDRGGDWVYGTLKPWIKRLPRRKRKAVQEVLDYMKPRLDKMRYPVFQARGLDIGSGPIESACKNVIARRLKGPGMRWTVPNANAMGELRGMLCSDRWHQVEQLIRVA